MMGVTNAYSPPLPCDVGGTDNATVRSVASQVTPPSRDRSILMKFESL
jgi:hypothetical protein